MKYILILLFLQSCTLFAQSNGRTFFVVPPDHHYEGMAQGSDNLMTRGNFQEPFATWKRAIEVAMPGDTVYFRGGTWYSDSEIRISPYVEYYGNGNDGKPGSRIYYLNYKQEKPIFDFINYNAGNGVSQVWKAGISLWRCNYMYFRGIEIKNVTQDADYVTCHGITAYGCSNVTFENVNVNHIGGKGFNFISEFQYEEFPEQNSFPGDTQQFINCDASFCMDSVVMAIGAEGDIGNYSDGFWINETGTVSHIIFRGCRSFMNSDDGYDNPCNCLVTLENCWSFKNGHLERGGGQGIRFPNTRTTPEVIVETFRSISASNQLVGFTEGYPEYGYCSSRNYNNFAFENGSWGWDIPGHRDPPLNKNVFKNNIGYKNGDYEAGINTNGGIYEHSHNTWLPGNSYQFHDPYTSPLPDISPPIELTNEDFVSLDVAELYRDRNAIDNSLPEISFGHLAEGSDMIDAGIDVGLSYNGDNPDLGVFEYEYDKYGNKYPEILIISPSRGAKYTSTSSIPIEVEVSDTDGSIASVEFLINGSVYKTLNSDPWRFEWDSPEVGNYTIRARAIDNLGAIATSRLIDINVEFDTGISVELDSMAADGYLLYPNPNNGIFDLYLSNRLQTVSKVDIFSLNGQLLYQEEMRPGNHLMIEVPYFTPGVYIISVSNPDERNLTAKFTVVKD